MDRHIPLVHSHVRRGNNALTKFMPAQVFVQRCGACLALVALALQLVMSFAHVHKHDVTFSGRARLNVASIGQVRPQRQAAEWHPSRLADDDENCTICFSSFLLANSSIPYAPAKLPFARME
ncbi:hypothetical protein XH93_10985 [Bradyrhizobium sp. CCBAU 51753]|nr:hypothetical protein XH93_10985 [Bradyrhizobium sp. CCBAU 51753]